MPAPTIVPPDLETRVQRIGTTLHALQGIADTTLYDPPRARMTAALASGQLRVAGSHLVQLEPEVGRLAAEVVWRLVHRTAKEAAEAEAAGVEVAPVRADLAQAQQDLAAGAGDQAVIRANRATGELAVLRGRNEIVAMANREVHHVLANAGRLRWFLGGLPVDTRVIDRDLDQAHHALAKGKVEDALQHGSAAVVHALDLRDRSLWLALQWAEALVEGMAEQGMDVQAQRGRLAEAERAIRMEEFDAAHMAIEQVVPYWPNVRFPGGPGGPPPPVTVGEAAPVRIRVMMRPP